MYQLGQRHLDQGEVVGARVVEEFVDDGVHLRDVGHHVFARFLVGHAHLGFQPQPGQRRAQVVRNAGQHLGAVLLDLGQLVGHAVEADVHLANLAGQRAFIQPGGLVVAVAHPRRGNRQLLERPVDQPRQQRRPDQGHGAHRGQPQQPRAAAQQRAHARAVHQQPVRVALDRKPHPQARFVVHAAGYDGVGPQARDQLVAHAPLQLGLGEKVELVAGLVRQDAHLFLVGQRLDERHSRDGVRVDQRSA